MFQKLIPSIICFLTTLNCISAELLPNNDFSRVYNGHPVYWRLHDWNGLSRLDMEPTGKDKGKCAVISSETVNGRATFIHSGKGLKVPQGTAFKISGWYKTEDFSFGPKGVLRVECKFNYISGKDKKSEYKIKHFSMRLEPTSGEWKQFETVTTVPYPVAEIYFFVLGYDFKGRIILRNPSIQPVKKQSEIDPKKIYVWREAEQIFPDGLKFSFARIHKVEASGGIGIAGKNTAFKWMFNIKPETDPDTLFPVKRKYYVWLRVYGYLERPQVDVFYNDKQIYSFRTIANEVTDAHGEYRAPGKYYWQKCGCFASDGGPGSLKIASRGRMLIDAILLTDDAAFEPVGFEAAKFSDKKLFTDIRVPSFVKALYRYNGVSSEIISPIPFWFYNEKNRQIKTGDKPAIIHILLPKHIEIKWITSHWGGVNWGRPEKWGEHRLAWRKTGSETFCGEQCNKYEVDFYFLGLTTTLYVRATNAGFVPGRDYYGQYYLEFNGKKQPPLKLSLTNVRLKPVRAFKTIRIGISGEPISSFYYDYPDMIKTLKFVGFNILNPWHTRQRSGNLEKFSNACLKNDIMLVGQLSPFLGYFAQKDSRKRCVTIDGETGRGPSLSLTASDPALTRNCEYVEQIAADGFGITMDDENTNQKKDLIDYHPDTIKLFKTCLRKHGLPFVAPATIVKDKKTYSRHYAAWVDFRCDRMIEFYRLYRQAYLRGFKKSKGKYTFGKTMMIPMIVRNCSPRESRENSLWDYKKLAAYSDYISPMLYIDRLRDTAFIGDTVKMYNDYIGKKIIVPTLTAGYTGCEVIPQDKPILKYEIFEALLQQSKIVLFWSAIPVLNPLNVKYISEAIDELRPYEEIILRGREYAGAQPKQQWARVKGLELDGRILLYAANYRNPVSEKVTITVKEKIKSVLEISTGKQIPVINNSFPVSFETARGKLFLVIK